MPYTVATRGEYGGMTGAHCKSKAFPLLDIEAKQPHQQAFTGTVLSDAVYHSPLHRAHALSLTHTLALTHTLVTQAHPLTLNTQSLALTHSLARSLFLTHSLTHSLALTDTLTLTHTHTRWHSLTLTHSHSVTRSLIQPELRTHTGSVQLLRDAKHTTCIVEGIPCPALCTTTQQPQRNISPTTPCTRASLASLHHAHGRA